MPASNFTYPRPVIDDVARCIRSARTSAWTDAQRLTLDHLIDIICHDMAEYHEGFDPERFMDKAGYWLGRLQPHPHREDQSHG